MKERIYRALVIGAGNQGSASDLPGSANQHKIISYGHALKEHPGFKLIGFIDTNMEKAAEAAIAWKTDYWSGYPIEAEVIIIATSDDNHYEPLKRALKHKPELVICEKPLTTNLDQAQEIVELYRAKGVPLMVNYTRNFLPHHRRVKQQGKPISGFCTFNRGWLHTASHAISFFQMIGLDHYTISQIDTEESRVWDLIVYFDNGTFWQERRIGDEPVWPYYDQAMYHVINNAYNFLEGREQLYCTGEDALATLEVCFKLMEGAR